MVQLRSGAVNCATRTVAATQDGQTTTRAFNELTGRHEIQQQEPPQPLPACEEPVPEPPAQQQEPAVLIQSQQTNDRGTATSFVPTGHILQNDPPCTEIEDGNVHMFYVAHHETLFFLETQGWDTWGAIDCSWTTATVTTGDGEGNSSVPVNADNTSRRGIGVLFATAIQGHAATP